LQYSGYLCSNILRCVLLHHFQISGKWMFLLYFFNPFYSRYWFISIFMKMQTGQVPHVWDLILAPVCLHKLFCFEKYSKNNHSSKFCRQNLKAAILYPSMQFIIAGRKMTVMSPLSPPTCQSSSWKPKVCPAHPVVTWPWPLILLHCGLFWICWNACNFKCTGLANVKCRQFFIV